MTKVTGKGVIIAILAAFALYSVIVAPETSADAVRSVFFFVGDVLRSIFSFFDALIN